MRVIVDANVMISALLGRSFPQLLALRESDIDLRAPVHQLRETRLILRHKRRLPEDIIDARMALLATVIDPVETPLYARFEAVARSRLEVSGQSDWPVLAAALSLEDSILSNDRDFFGVGVAVWSSRVLRREMETVSG